MVCDFRVGHNGPGNGNFPLYTYGFSGSFLFYLELCDSRKYSQGNPVMPLLSLKIQAMVENFF